MKPASEMTDRELGLAVAYFHGERDVVKVEELGAFVRSLFPSPQPSELDQVRADIDRTARVAQAMSSVVLAARSIGRDVTMDNLETEVMELKRLRARERELTQPNAEAPKPSDATLSMERLNLYLCSDWTSESMRSDEQAGDIAIRLLRALQAGANRIQNYIKERHLYSGPDEDALDACIRIMDSSRNARQAGIEEGRRLEREDAKALFLEAEEKGERIYPYGAINGGHHVGAAARAEAAKKGGG